MNMLSALCATVAFLLLGCALAIGGVAVGMETSVLKLGILAYLFMAGPVFLASFTGRWSLSKHKSFRATAPAYLKGKRVKPRLWRLAAMCSSLAIAAMFGAFACLIWVAGRFKFLSEGNPWAFIMFPGVPVFAYAFAHIVFAFVSVKLGWATKQEAGELLTKGHGWPEAWLEPLDEKPKG